jgi:ATP-binding cassette subfamily B protein
VEHTAHFELRMPEHGFAETRAWSIGSGLEEMRSNLLRIMAFAEEQLPARCTVYLVDVLPQSQVEPEPLLGRVVPERDEVWAVYRPDSPGQELTQATVRLLLLRATATDLDFVPVIERALVDVLTPVADAFLAAEKRRQLFYALGDHPPSLISLLTGETGDRTLQVLAVSSFLTFLLENHGPLSLREFVLAATNATGEKRWEALRGKQFARLEREWREFLSKQAGAGRSGIMDFLRGSAHYLRPYWKEEIAIIGFLFVLLAFQQILPRAQALLIDQAILPRDLQYLARLILFLFVMVLFALTAGVLRDFLTTRVSESVLRGMRERMFLNLQRASHRFYSRMGSGDILSRFGNDLHSVQQGLTGTLTQGVFLIFSLVFSTIHILLVSLPLSIMALAALPLFFLTTKLLGPRANRASLAYSKDQAALTSELQENLAAQPVIKAYTLQTGMVQRFGDQARDLYRSALRVFFLSSLYGTSANLLTTVIQVASLALGGYLVIQGQLMLGSLMEFLALLGLVIGPVQGITGLLQAIQIATASMDRVEEILNADAEVSDAPNAQAAEPLMQSILFEHVSFSYTGERPQLDDMTFEIPAGTTAAFVGPSGSGKSTVVNLLLRFYDPSRGTVRFDGHDLRELSLESLRRQVAPVFQDNFLFNTTLRENIRFGREAATDAEVEQAAREAELHDSIVQLEQGYETVVGERGGSLSGGQRQRVAIARAVLRGASVVVFDEATSALDPKTERSILESLERFSRGRTCIWITHRLSSASRADKIFVLDRGRLVEQGTHSELLKINGLYRRLYEEQAGMGSEGQRALQISYLRAVPLFAGLDEAMLARIAGFLHTQQAATGEDIVRAGAMGDKFFLIVSGSVEVLDPTGDGIGPPLARLSPGEYFGEIALLRDVPRTATVRAEGDTQLLVLEKDSLLGLFEFVPELRSRLEATLAAREAATVAPPKASTEAAIPGPPSPRADAWLVQAEAGAQIYFTLDAVRTRIGRSPQNEVVLDDPTVSAFHAELERATNQAFFISDLGSTNGTELNGFALGRSPVGLVDGDRIRIGDHTLIFELNRRRRG